MDEKANLDSKSSSPDGQPIQSAYIRPSARKPYDASITLEEYNFYARKTREEEKSFKAPKTQWSKFFSRKSSGEEDLGRENDSSKITMDVDNRFQISDEEWTNASRAFRTASMGAAFYLVRHLRYGVFQCRC